MSEFDDGFILISLSLMAVLIGAAINLSAEHNHFQSIFLVW